MFSNFFSAQIFSPKNRCLYQSGIRIPSVFDNTILMSFRTFTFVDYARENYTSTVDDYRLKSSTGKQTKCIEIPLSISCNLRDTEKGEKNEIISWRFSPGRNTVSVWTASDMSKTNEMIPVPRGFRKSQNPAGRFRRPAVKKKIFIRWNAV